MPEPENILQKAFYLGVGIASYAAEKAGDKLQELRQQAQKLAENQDFPQQLQKLADDMVSKGKITTEEARKVVDEMIRQAQQQPPTTVQEEHREPRPIEIITEEEETKE
jgi:polyhydroxyalkanoate synthesis regulator phasin